MTPRSKAGNGGFALITAMVLMVVLAIVSTMLFRTSGTESTVAGNTLEHQRAFESAESALRYGEWLLRQSPLPTEVELCNTVIDLSELGTSPTICRNALETPQQLPWPAGMQYVPEGMTVKAGGGLLATDANRLGRDVFYAARPMLYIQNLGRGADGLALYQITAAGFGGNVDTVSVLVSVVSLQ